ncbi:hypothetical protein GCM10008018_51130 [Paenibacillus marchantiophytorum]|uniref:Glycoside hydrolase family 42 N-terminal domain-containing protein n=1 Tax=Paenibacillus marchantiophytorum TaxID=1619310 RepID=A0ABQ1F3W2_9BACL|nr:hypothetical protein GCM10008018_51130 [Paenibacillus marchantiophytorum]
MFMDQTPSQQDWQPYNSLNRPGVMKLWSYQADPTLPSTRTTKDNHSFLFILKYNDHPTSIELGSFKGTDLISGLPVEITTTLPPKAVMILES